VDRCSHRTPAAVAVDHKEGINPSRKWMKMVDPYWSKPQNIDISRFARQTRGSPVFDQLVISECYGWCGTLDLLLDFMIKNMLQMLYDIITGDTLQITSSLICRQMHVRTLHQT